MKLLGVTEQLIGDEHLGVAGFRYAGSLGPIAITSADRHALTHLGVALAQRHDLRGLFGVDLVRDRKGDLWPVELNPRYTASVEIIERATDIPCLSDWPIATLRKSLATPAGVVHAKGIVFAKQDCVVPDLYGLFESHEVADVPEIGERIRQGKPICTVFAFAREREECVSRLRERAARVYTAVSE